MILEGRNAINEALKGGVTIEKLMVLKNHNPSLNQIVSTCKKNKVKVVYVEKVALDKLSENNHQGIIAIATDFEYSTFNEVVNNTLQEKKLIIILDGIEDPHNLGAIIRIADAVAANGIIIQKHRCCGVTDTAIRVSSGASAHVKIAKVTNINDAIRDLKKQNIWVYSADMQGENLYQSALTEDIAIVIGNEGKGVSPLTKKLSDGSLALPQLGKVNSLNAAVAAGAILYECVRQRQLKK